MPHFAGQSARSSVVFFLREHQQAHLHQPATLQRLACSHSHGDAFMKDLPVTQRLVFGRTEIHRAHHVDELLGLPRRQARPFHRLDLQAMVLAIRPQTTGLLCRGLLLHRIHRVLFRSLWLSLPIVSERMSQHPLCFPPFQGYRSSALIGRYVSTPLKIRCSEYNSCNYYTIVFATTIREGLLTQGRPAGRDAVILNYGKSTRGTKIARWPPVQRSVRCGSAIPRGFRIPQGGPGRGQESGRRGGSWTGGGR